MALFAGWNVLGDYRELRGTVIGHQYFGADGDWCLYVLPSVPDYDYLRFNRAGKPNEPDPENVTKNNYVAEHANSSIVECEIELPDKAELALAAKRGYLPGHAFDYRSLVEASLWRPLVGKEITMVGTWVEDTGHDDKTEIHPITSILVEDEPSTSTKRIEFFVFSDDSAGGPWPIFYPVPYQKENRLGKFRVPYPANVSAPNYRIVDEEDMARWKSFSVVRGADNRWVLTGYVESGIPEEDKGFYHAVIELTFQRGGNYSTFVSASVPRAMEPGQRYDTSVTMRNSGASTWTSVGNPYRLGSQNPQDNTTWGIGRVELPQPQVPPGSEATFNFRITAPSTPGSYQFQWRMLQETVEWFGDFTPATPVRVIDPGKRDKDAKDKEEFKDGEKIQKEREEGGFDSVTDRDREAGLAAERIDEDQQGSGASGRSFVTIEERPDVGGAIERSEQRSS